MENINGGNLAGCQGFLFDKDGTLIDFNYLWLNWSLQAANYLASRVEGLTTTEVLAQWGVDHTAGRVDSEGPMAVGSLTDLIGSAAGLVYRHQGLWLESRQLVSEAVEEAYSSINKASYSRLIDGVSEVIKSLAGRGYKLAVVTTDETGSAYDCLEATGIVDYFQVVLGCDQVQNCKPYPDLALTACRLMGVSPNQVAVIGDTRADMLMGYKAGVYHCVGVTSGVGNAAELAHYADVVLESVAHFPV